MNRRLKESQKFGHDFDIDPLWCAWFSGLVDGEGCFHIRLKPICAELKITLRDDEYKTVYEIKEKLRCGFINDMSNRSMRLAGHSVRDGVMYRVVAVNEICNIIIPLLDKYPLHTKKKSRYLKWRKAAMIILEGKHLEGSGLEDIRKLKLEISADGKTHRVDQLIQSGTIST